MAPTPLPAPTLPSLGGVEGHLEVTPPGPSSGSSQFNHSSILEEGANSVVLPPGSRSPGQHRPWGSEMASNVVSAPKSIAGQNLSPPPPPLPHQTPTCPMRRARTEATMGVAGCWVLREHPSAARCTQGTRRGVGQGAGRANGPHRVLRIHRLGHSTAREHREHPPILLTRRKREETPPRRVGKGIGSTSVLPLQAG